MRRILTVILAFCILLGTLLPVYAATEQMTLPASKETLLLVLIIIYVVLFVLLLSCVLFSIGALSARKSKRRRKNPGQVVMRIVMYSVTMIVLACAVFCTMRYLQIGSTPAAGPEEPSQNISSDIPEVTPTQEPVENTTEEGTEPIVPPEPQAVPTLSPSMTEGSDPANWGVDWQLQVNGNPVDSYQSEDIYNFTWASDYYPLPGVATFRGDNYRTGATYGTASITQEELVKKWSREVGSLNGWPGIGWTGQPLCVQWDEETKAIMNLYPEKKSKKDLVEVIATTLDGYIYFYDLDDGSYTRDRLWIGMGFKGTASLDPRGYPILYAGSGLNNGSKYPRMFIISLIDCSLLMEKSGGDDFAYRGWYAFDSSPMISAEADTLFWPGESGVIYSIKLTTNNDKAAGTLTMSPETLVKARYSTSADRTVGYEASSIMVGNYMFIGDNGGMFYCIDLHTMALVWAQSVKDDVNATPVFEWGDDGEGYLYVASSMEYSNNTAYIYKLSASTGEIIWTKEYNDVTYDYDVSGGVLSSPVLGKEGTDLEGMIIYTVAKTPSAWSGTMVALDTDTGAVVWEKTMSNYAWSSPVSLYTPAGKGYIVIGDSVGYIYLIDGSTGETLHTEGLGSNIEASPVVFNNRLVVGTRGCQVWCVEVE